jgi:hypothetical protein
MDFQTALEIARTATADTRKDVAEWLREFVSKRALEVDEINATLSYEESKILRPAYGILHDLNEFIKQLEE